MTDKRKPRLIEITGGTFYLDGEKPSGVRIQAKNDDGWLRVEITADAGITGYSVSVNGHDLPYDASAQSNHEAGADPHGKAGSAGDGGLIAEKSLRGTDYTEVMADFYEAIDGHWRTTQEIAKRAGYEWRPGASINAYARNALFALAMNADVEHLSRQNGHLWKRGA